MADEKKVFDVLVIEKGSNDKTYWRNVGVGFLNKDGSINLRLYMFPELSLQARERTKENQQR